MIIYTEIIGYIFIWFIVSFLIINRSWKAKDINSGLTIVYVVHLFLIHGLAALLYLLPWHRYINGQWMLYGLREATYAAAAFAAGNLILASSVVNMFFSPHRVSEGADKAKSDLSSNLPIKYFWIGLISYVVLPPLIIGIPTVTSVLSAAQQLVIVGICLICWQAWTQNDKKRFRRWLLFVFLLPFSSIILMGFLGVGISMALVIILFVARFFRPKWKLFILGLVSIYIGISLYQTYMRDRETLRAAVWGGARISKRLKLLGTSITHPAWFSIFDLEQLERIDQRMNQNILVGAAVDYTNSRRIEYAHGRTISDSVVALIPRAFWKEKPITAGSSAELITKYTGLEFAENTAVGMGQVMESYINFGRGGVILIFLILGILIGVIDTMSGYHLKEGNFKKFTIWFLPGLAFINVGGAFTEVTASAGAAVFLAYFITYRNVFIILLILFFLIRITREIAMRFLPF